MFEDSREPMDYESDNWVNPEPRFTISEIRLMNPEMYRSEWRPT